MTESDTRAAILRAAQIGALGFLASAVHIAIGARLGWNADARSAVLDVFGALSTSASLSSVLALPALSSGSALRTELLRAVLAIAATAWICAIWPPTGATDFVSAYVPASLLATVVARGAWLRWPRSVLYALAAGTMLGLAGLALAKRFVHFD